MLLDAMHLTPDLSEMAAWAHSAETLGFDGLVVSETKSDPFLALTLAAEHTQRLTLSTGIAVAFPRSPTILAHLAWDLARFSHGRFILGLGPQVRAHVERRFGAAWEKPVRRLRETIEAIRAVWHCWQTGEDLYYEGEFFTLDLMTPFFSTGPLPYPPPPIYIAAVNHQMLKLAGSACDGVFLHALHSVKYLQEVAWPSLRQGLEQAGRSRQAFSAAAGVFVVPTDDPQPASVFEAYVRQQLSFYMSTPAYRSVLELHGWEGIAIQLSRLARRGDWEAMPKLINDAMLDAFAVSGAWGELPGKIQTRYGDLLDRISYYWPYTPGASDDGWRATLAGFKGDGGA